MGTPFKASLLVLSVVVTALACSEEPSKKSAGTIAEGCIINSDCNAPLVCAFRRCHTACENNRDCEPGLNCMVSDRPFHVCQLPDEQKCRYNSQCPEG
ncbi:MAG: hypothetical protein FJ104_13290, partial [Deltaproteobacteria bacterium]|nr:hypothetical protein [Deltaproteobacteria bacterium]